MTEYRTQYNITDNEWRVDNTSKCTVESFPFSGQSGASIETHKLSNSVMYPPQYNSAESNLSMPSFNRKAQMRSAVHSSNISTANPFEMPSQVLSNIGNNSMPLTYGPGDPQVFNVNQMQPSFSNFTKSNFSQIQNNFTNVSQSVNSSSPYVPVNDHKSCASRSMPQLPVHTAQSSFNYNGLPPGNQPNILNPETCHRNINREIGNGKVPFCGSEANMKESSNWQSSTGVSVSRTQPQEQFTVSHIQTTCSSPFAVRTPQIDNVVPPIPLNQVNNFNRFLNNIPNNFGPQQPMRFFYTPSMPPPPMLPNCEMPPPPMPFENKVQVGAAYNPKQNFYSNTNILTAPPPSLLSTAYPPPQFSSQNITVACDGKSNTSVTSYQNNFSGAVKVCSEKERLLSEFLQRFGQKKQKEKKDNLTVVEFRTALKISLSLSKMLFVAKCNLTKLLQSDEDSWQAEMKRVSQMKSQLADICNMLSNPNNILVIQKKLKRIKKKRELKQKQKEEALCEKMKAEQNRKVLNQEIDKWLDSIKEKNMKLKREAEMKKEADNILSEVRRKIHEAKRTIEKLKVFEKLRNARKANAFQKGLFILPEHDESFENKMSVLKETMLKQLSDYEAEERALKVMLETEQEGQLEEEALWRIKKIKTLQQKKQRHIYECLFGDTEEPSPEDPLYLFYQHQNSANSSIESLVQI
ncbi:Programmed cell death protein 7, partial [Stegodyphus mimosarum]